MNLLLAGATGATGRLLVEQLLDRGHRVKAIVRSPEKLDDLKERDKLRLIQASILDLSDKEIAKYVKGCDGVASCLGHNLTLRGIFGHPRRLVTDACRRLCKAIRSNQPQQPVRFVLMNTAGNRNRDLDEPISFRERVIIGLLRLLLPPHVDNEQAAEYLRTKIGPNNPFIEWVAVRPDSLIDESQVSAYKAYPSPMRSALFNAGQTSRINVAHFMADLITDNNTWHRWKGCMPVIYNTLV